MKNKSRLNKVIIEKILDYCDKIERIIQRFDSSYEKFNADFVFQLSCGMCIVQIGELTKRFTEEFRSQHSEIAWTGIKATRNIYVHEYEKVDIEEVWSIITNDIPELKENLMKILFGNGRSK